MSDQSLKELLKLEILEMESIINLKRLLDGKAITDQTSIKVLYEGDKNRILCRLSLLREELEGNDEFKSLIKKISEGVSEICKDDDIDNRYSKPVVESIRYFINLNE